MVCQFSMSFHHFLDVQLGEAVPDDLESFDRMIPWLTVAYSENLEHRRLV